MSVMNDSLSPASGVVAGTRSVSISHLELRPGGHATGHRRGVRLTLPAVVYVTLLLAILVLGVVWLRTLNNRIQTGAVSPAPAEPVATLRMEPARPTPVKPVAVAAPVGSVSTPVAASPAGAADPSAAAVEAVPEEPVPLRLQAVFFNPARPSAIISGKTVFVGDRCRDYRVTQIQPNSATLAKGAESLVLKLR
jgi:hypothetical protein